MCLLCICIYIYIYWLRGSSRHVARSTHVYAPQPFRPTERAAIKAGIASLAALSTYIHLIHMRATYIYIYIYLYLNIYIYIYITRRSRPPRRGRKAASAAAAAEDAI